MYPEAEQIGQIIDSAETIVIVQADNPDADSLGSALALESILGEMGKQPHLYCGVEMPGYLRYMQGWDRVSNELPKQFDASIIVDASTMTLLEKLELSGQKGWLASKPCIVLDHHESVEKIVPFATVMINDHERASTGELIYRLSKQLNWKLPLEAQEFLTTSILGDTQGLSNQLTSAETYRIMADFVEAGVDRPALEEMRREYGKMPTEIYKYKAVLIQRTEFAADGRVALVTIPQNEINEFSPLYNPAPLIQGDMLQTTGVEVAIVLKQYADGKITGAIRCNPKSGIAAELAESLGGGGHAFASGFKVLDKPFDELKAQCLNSATELLDKLSANEAL
jgi:phosphoesterase RecJ-like protein